MNDFHFEAKNGERIFRYGVGIVVDTNTDDCVWWSYEKKRWIKDINRDNLPVTSMAPCRTLKAFKRHLRKHTDDLVGCKVVFVNRFIGYNITYYV